jgi:heme/copper-type cytochrome/quinol oxidase subunit 4
LRSSLFYDIALLIICGGIAIFSFALAQAESPSWQAVISIIIVLITVVAVIYSLWYIQKRED